MIYKCNNCGGNVVYRPDKKAMFCAHCDSLDSENTVPQTSMENCANCGAPLRLEPYTSACKCEHCGIYYILDEKVSGEYLPHLILPFQLGKEDAKEKLKQEFKKRTFTPMAFLSEASLAGMEGSYVPFFLYDYISNVDFEGTGTKVRVWRTGNKEHTETSTYSVYRNMTIDFDKIPVDASEKMNDGIMDLMEPYLYQALEGFQEKFMSGFFAEFYSKTAEELKNRAVDKARNDSESLLSDTIHGYTSVVTLRKNIDLSDEQVHYALLPVWIYRFSFRSKIYEFHVNGQTGKVIGKSPISVAKVFLYSGSLLGFLLSIGFLIREIMEVFS